MLPDGFIFIQRDWLSSNSLLLKNDKAAFLIDSGYLTHADMTLKVLEKHLNGQQLDVILNTHLHSDHCGGNSLLQQRYPSLSIHVPSSQLHTVNSWNSSNLTFDKTGQCCNPFSASVGLIPGDVIDILGLTWEIIGSPGHDSDSVMFFQSDFRILVSADALWETNVSVVFPEFDNSSGFEAAISTFDAIERLNPRLVIPGHGRMFTDVTTALQSSRSKMIQFINDPKYHAKYSAKVLLKFKLMELGRIQHKSFIEWCITSQLLKHIHNAFFYTIDFKTWINEILEEFTRKLSIDYDGQSITNL